MSPSLVSAAGSWLYLWERSALRGKGPGRTRVEQLASKSMEEKQLHRALDLTRNARRVEFFTGAGMSAESGLDTYRDAETGVWEKVDPQAMASISAWARDPEPMWAWYLWRARLAAQANPNAGHHAIARWVRLEGVDKLQVTTQNIDDLHERGGMADTTHLHGNLFRFRCTICHRPWKGPVNFPTEPVARLSPPTCPLCGNLIRPDIVWFGESLPQREWERAELGMREADLVVIIGTSGVVQPAASLPLLAHQRGVPILEISPARSELTPLCEFSWRATAATALPALVSALESEVTGG
ncbi:NAD-dependent protein deacylase [Corynebacterium occultum]|uniref:NAD-dependent protein deacylase n=2 Tax=Corynebacterium occultum TaxID=2675219 RepID=A0A6B8VPW6_9CORY|nr:NAD-dependent protein deacylase [Corynebacterium occultum]